MGCLVVWGLGVRRKRGRGILDAREIGRAIAM